MHITCPINIYSRSAARICAGGVKVPLGKVKVKSAIELFLKQRQLKSGVEIDLNSELETGKGMSSSSADIVAALDAAANLFSSDISKKEMAVIALSVEPTDGIFLDGIAVFDHHRGLVAKTIGTVPQLGVVFLDFGGFVNTVDFASQRIQYDHEELRRLKHAFALVENGIIKRDYWMLGAGATISARVNQRFLFKPQLEAVILAVAGAYGVNVAHSGTVIGVLVELTCLDEYRQRLKALFPQAKIATAHIVDGGVRNNVCAYS